MAKNPATTRIPRGDGISRIPKLGNLPTTSHIRPPSSFAGVGAGVAAGGSAGRGVGIKATQIFRPSSSASASKLRPKSAQSKTLKAPALKELGATFKESVNMLSKGTTAMRKYFANSKAAASPMTSSLPPSKRSMMVYNEKLIASTPMPLMRSETFVCSGDEEENDEDNEEEHHQTGNETLRFESTRLSNFGFGHTIDIVDSPDKSKQANLTHTINNTTKPTTAAETVDGGGGGGGAGTAADLHTNVTRNLSELASPLSNATYSQAGSMDNLPLLEHMSMPSGLDLESAKPPLNEMDVSSLDATLVAQLMPDKANMKLPLNSTANTERLLDISGAVSPARHIQLLNLTRQLQPSTPPCRSVSRRSAAQHTLLYLSPQPGNTPRGQPTPMVVHLLSPLLKSAQSDLVLPTRTPDEEAHMMDTDTTLIAAQLEQEQTIRCEQQQQLGSLQEIHQPMGKQKARLSFGLDLPDTTLDCSIELVDNSYASTAARNSLPSSNLSQCSQLSSSQQQLLKKQNSFDLDESLGILTPNQMKEFLDTNTQNNANNLELHLSANSTSRHSSSHLNSSLTSAQQRLSMLRMDQTPSPEELPLDPVEVKTDISELLLQQQQQQHQKSAALAVVAGSAAGSNYSSSASSSTCASQQAALQPQLSQAEPHSLHTDTEHSKAEALSKSCNSKISNSFITSVTSVTSLDTGYQGDGEMSRPASRGAGEHSPSNGPSAHKVGVSRQPSFQHPAVPALAPMRRADPMTDSDFFTESDADDVFQRGDRRAQVIDGQLYGPTMQPTASVFIAEDSCMESSGIFTDVENRCDEDPAQMRRQDTQEAVDVDMSPDAEGGDDSTETVKSQLRLRQAQPTSAVIAAVGSAAFTADAALALGQGHALSASTTASSDRLSSSACTTLSNSNRTSYCSVDGGSAALAVDAAKSFAEQAFMVVASQSDQRLALPAVQCQTSARTHVHGSLSSLCVEKFNTLSASAASTPSSSTSLTPSAPSSAASTPKSCKTPRASDTDAAVAAAASAVVNKNTLKLDKSGSQRAFKLTCLASTGSHTPLARKPKLQTPNKWDAVMNKIASNKPLIKTNYNDVKSKVSTIRALTNSSNSPSKMSSGANTSLGTLSPRASPSGSGSGSGSGSARRSPSLSARSSTGSPAAKPVKPKTLIIKRSSNSPKVTLVAVANGTPSPTSARQPRDKGSVSVGVGSGSGSGGRSAASPAATVKTPTSPPAKRFQANSSVLLKRGRSYSKESPSLKSSHSDLSSMGAGKENRNVNEAAKVTKAPLRAAKKRDLHNLNISPTDLGPPPKTQQTIKGQSTRITKSKTPTPTAIQKRSLVAAAATSTSGLKLKSKESIGHVDQTELQELQRSPTCTDDCLTNKDKRYSINSAAETNSTARGGKTPNGKRNEVTPDKQIHANGTKSDANGEVSGEVTAITTAAALGYEIGKDLAKKYPSLRPFLKNDRLDYMELDKCLASNILLQNEVERKVLGLGVTVQHMSSKIDEFNQKEICERSSKAKLHETEAILEQVQLSCEDLREQLRVKDMEWVHHETELKHVYQSEIKKAQECLQEERLLAQERVLEMENKLQAKEQEANQNMHAYRMEMSIKLKYAQEQLEAAQQQVISLQARLQKIEAHEQDLRERMTRKDNAHTVRIAAATQRETELSESLKTLTKELNSLRASSELTERDMRDSLMLAQDELAVLRNASARQSVNGSQNSSLDGSAELCRLTREADSLRCVLELKQAEISTLSKKNAELKRDNEEHMKNANKVALLEAQMEMLQTEIENKVDKEKEYLRQMDEMTKVYNHDTYKRQRLTLDNEVLQYTLKQRSEKLQLVEAELQRRSGQESSPNCTHHSTRSNNSTSRWTDSASPPASPIIKGVIEKSDSVSWVLEMEDETPEVAASKMVKRAGSLRSCNERSPVHRRQLSVSASSAGVNGFTSANNGTSNGPNPLSQSMSATALLRSPHCETENRPTRPRSYSVSLKDTEMESEVNVKATPKMSTKSSAAAERRTKSSAKTTRRQRSGSELQPDWHDESLYASSPCNSAMRGRSSTMKQTLTSDTSPRNELFTRSSKASTLITCDSSALTNGERLDLHSSQKFQEIQESAGEAMVSGANSEDESCSASSEEMRSSTSSTASGEQTSAGSPSKHQEQSRMSIEEALLRERGGSLNGTPMDVSWSEDVVIEANGVAGSNLKNA